jgi:hypothetical protein
MKFFSFNRIAVTAVALFLAVFLFSCQKESSVKNNSQENVTEDEAVVYSEESMETEASFDDIQDISFSAADEEGMTSAGKATEAGRFHLFAALRLRIGNCAEITVTPDDGTYPKTVTIDFGNGCQGVDGKFRKGAIILHFTGPIRRPGSVLTVTLRDFYLNRVHIEGTKIISNLSENGNIKFTVQVVNGKVTFPGGRGYKYDAMKYVKQIEGGSTDEFRDDVYSIEGRSKTEFRNGFTLTLNTESPLIKKVACPWISNGVLKIKIDKANSWVFFLDYGAPNNGDCDNKALLTWRNNGRSKLITLP